MPRASVLWFADQMELKLAAHDHKGGWEHVRDAVLFTQLLDEMRELHESLAGGLNGPDPRHIIEECADVANIAHMLADHAQHDLDASTRFRRRNGST